VSGVNLVKKHQKPNPQMNIQGGIIEKEAPIAASNVAIFNPETKKGDRVGFNVDKESGKKVRIFKSTKKVIGE
jgi:large subunit ribosomal protein L24